MASKLAGLVNDIKESQIRMEGRMEFFMTELARHRMELSIAKTDISSLQAYRSRQKGIWMAILIVGSLLSGGAVVVFGVLGYIK